MAILSKVLSYIKLKVKLQYASQIFMHLFSHALTFVYTCESGGIGRRTGFRYQRRKA